MRSKLRLALVAVALLTVCPSPNPAAAGTYTVRQCDHAAGITHHDFRWQAAGAPAPIPHAGSACTEFGLAARNSSVGREQTYPSGGYGGWFAYAPLGTSFTRFAGSFGTLVGCCINGLASYAEAAAPGHRTYLFQGSLGNDSWYAPSGLQGPIGRGWDASAAGFAAKSVGFYLRCGPGFSCFQRTTGDLRVRGRSFDFTLRDDVKPGLAPLGGSLTSPGWLRGRHSLAFAAGDLGGGIAGVTATFDNGSSLSAPSNCPTIGGRYIRLQPCPLDRSSSWSIDTAKLPDGVRTVTVRTTDASGASAQVTRPVRVDNTPPSSPIAPWVVGGSGWRRMNGFTVKWSNPAGQHAPVTAARFRACPVGGGTCITGTRTSAGVSSTGAILLPRAGEWDARVWLVDAAGNGDSSLASPPQRLRFDPDPAALRFLARDARSPTIVRVGASDRSGLVSGGIDLRRLGSDRWERLDTTLTGAALTANVDDSLRRGRYELRATAVDVAGNRAVVQGPAQSLPLRSATRLSGAVLRRLSSGRVVRRSAVRSPYGQLVALHARLLDATGRPLAGRPVTVALASQGARSRRHVARTDSRGGLVVLVRTWHSAAVHLRFDGDMEALPSARRLAIHVPAPVTFRATKRELAPGRRTVFAGRVRAATSPAAASSSRYRRTSVGAGEPSRRSARPGRDAGASLTGSNPRGGQSVTSSVPACR